MNSQTSKLETNRQTGRNQVSEQRASILDAAERLFLQNGIVHTKMVDIAAEVGITKITLYRYFPNRDMIALEIHERMINKIAAQVDVDEWDVSFETARKMARSMIRNYESLKDAYRYMGMFDNQYLDNPPESAMAQWTKNQLLAFTMKGANIADLSRQATQGNRFVMVLSTVIWFLEKLALRGELTWSDQSVPLEEHLRLFEEMILGYIERFGGEAWMGDEPVR
jgi:AcrR family transcriptional regulator